MLTDQDTHNIAYGAWQTHEKTMLAQSGLVAPSERQLMRKWDENRFLRTLWVGIVKGMMINTAAAVQANERAKTPASKASPVQSVLDRIRGNRQDRSNDQAAFMGHDYSVPPARNVVDMHPGLAIGRCTETPQDTGCTDAGPTDSGSSSGGCDSGASAGGSDSGGSGSD